MSFYLTLPSSVHLSGINDNNTISSYFTRLARPLELSAEEWEVGLAEIIYPLSLENQLNGKIVIKAPNGKTYVVQFQPGQYVSFFDVLSELKKTEERVRSVSFISSELSFDYFYTSNTFSVGVGAGMHVGFEGDLASIMGFPSGKLMAPGVHTSSSKPNLLGKNDLLYVYGSFAAPRVVGDARVPLLRVFPVSEGGNNKLVRKEFEEIQYIPISNLSSDMVEIDIRRDDGSIPPFSAGNIVLTVHFRKKSPIL